MDPRERYSDHQEALRAALEGHQAQVWTSLPGIIESFDPVAVTASVQAAIKGQIKDRNGATSHVALPLLVDVPVVFPRGGGFTLTFPVRAGDECLIVFASRCIDGWWDQGGVQPALDMRMHDLSDAFAQVGPQSRACRLAGISTEAAQLRSDDGGTVLEVGGGTITLTAPTSVTINSPTAHFTGGITAAGDVVAGTVSLQRHTHSGNGSGPPNQ